MRTIIVLFTTGVAILGLQQRNVAPIAYLMAKAAQTRVY